METRDPIEQLRKWVRNTRKDGLGPAGTNLEQLDSIADEIESRGNGVKPLWTKEVVERDDRILELEAKVEALTETLGNYDGDTYYGGTIEDWYGLATRLQGQVEEMERTHTKLPIGEDGLPIRLGDVVAEEEFRPEGGIVVGMQAYSGIDHWLVNCGVWVDSRKCRRVGPNAVEEGPSGSPTSCKDGKARGAAEGACFHGDLRDAGGNGANHIDVRPSEAAREKPAHYTASPVETIDKVNAVVAGLPAEQAWLLGNVVKYVDRAGRKLDAADDLSKAHDYAHRLVFGEWDQE